MNAPITRPLDDVLDGDEYPARTALRLKAESGSSISSQAKVNSENDNSTNKPLPWFVLIALIAGAALGYAINSAARIDNRALAAENRALAAETMAKGAIDIANARAATAEAMAKSAADIAKISEREARMQQYYLLEVDGKLIKLGVGLPDGGYQRFKEKRESGK